MKKLFLVLALVTLGQITMAQANTDSPYSRYGLGTLRTLTPNARMQAMGGLSIPMAGNTLINVENPASYAMLDSLTFLFDANFYFKTARLTQNATENHKALSETSSNASFDYAAIAFSTFKWWKMSLGLMPYSNVNYGVTVLTHPANDAIADYKTKSEGEGGVNQVFWGNGFRINKNFAIGLNASYLFGNTMNNTTLYFPDSTNMFATYRASNLMISNFIFDYGFLYQARFNSLIMNIGATYSQTQQLSSERNLHISSLYGGLGGTEVETMYDTTDIVKYAMPQSMGFGISLAKTNRWLIGADFKWTEWKDFEIGGINDSLQNSWKISFGGEYNPKSSSISGYFARMSYRAGFYYEQTNMNIDGHSINNAGFTLGFNMPLPRSLTTLNVALQIGQMGTNADDLIRDSYAKLSVGMSIYDRWFVKRKYK